LHLKMASIVVKMASVALLGAASHMQRDFPYAAYAPSVGTPEATAGEASAKIPTNAPAKPASKPSTQSVSTSEHDSPARSAEAKKHAASARTTKEYADSSASKSDRSVGMGGVTSSMQREKQALASLSAALSKYKDAAVDAEALQKEVDKAEKEYELAAKAVADAVGLVRDAKSDRLKAVKADMHSDPLAAKAASTKTMSAAEAVVSSAQMRLVDASALLKTASGAVETASAKAKVAAERKSKYEEQVKDARQKADEASKDVKKAQDEHARDEQKRESDAEELQNQLALIKQRMEKSFLASKVAPHSANAITEGK